MADTQDFVITEVIRVGKPLFGKPRKWDLHLGPDDGDPWISATLAELGEAPKIGGIVTVALPRVVDYVAPYPRTKE